MTNLCFTGPPSVETEAAEASSDSAPSCFPVGRAHSRKNGGPFHLPKFSVPSTPAGLLQRVASVGSKGVIRNDDAGGSSDSNNAGSAFVSQQSAPAALGTYDGPMNVMSGAVDAVQACQPSEYPADCTPNSACATKVNRASKPGAGRKLQELAVQSEIGSQRSKNDPNELLVLVHGLQGAVEDFAYLSSQLSHSEAVRNGLLVVHTTDVNTDKTHDGIVNGGQRLAEDIERMVKAMPSLTRLSLVGFSLGGIYVRFAIGLLYDRGKNTIAGLKPWNLITVATPNLGVRSFGVYRFIPQPLIGATKFLFGATGDQLVLNDDSRCPLLLKLTTDDNTFNLPFISALRSFTKRFMYGNMRQDFMVNWGSSVLDASVQEMGGNDLREVIHARALAARSSVIDSAFDHRGCKVAFSYDYPLPPPPGREAESISSTSDEIHKDWNPDDSNLTIEEVMAQRLQSMSWKVFAVDFPLPIPIAHNRIVAMSRGPIHSRMNAPGRRVVMHLVDTLLSDYDDHQTLFVPILPPEKSSGS